MVRLTEVGRSCWREVTEEITGQIVFSASLMRDQGLLKICVSTAIGLDYFVILTIDKQVQD